MNRREEQSELILSIGMVFGPMIQLAEDTESIPVDEKRRIMGRFCAEINQFEAAAHRFTAGEPGCTYNQEWRAIHSHTHAMQDLTLDVFKKRGTADTLRRAARELLELVSSIPVRDAKEIFEAESPFAAYRHFRSLARTVSKELQWQDRYFDLSVFDRYLSLVPQSARVTLVTWPRSECKGKRDEDRYEEFLRISRLFAAERGVHGYRLVTNDSIHARWLLCDDRMYMHDDSIKDLGIKRTFTISKLESTAENRRHFDNEAAAGTEIFGLTQPTHL